MYHTFSREKEEDNWIFDKTEANKATQTPQFGREPVRIRGGDGGASKLFWKQVVLQKSWAG